jgi:hypothetical protein
MFEYNVPNPKPIRCCQYTRPNHMHVCDGAGICDAKTLSSYSIEHCCVRKTGLKTVSTEGALMTPKRRQRKLCPLYLTSGIPNCRSHGQTRHHRRVNIWLNHKTLTWASEAKVLHPPHRIGKIQYGVQRTIKETYRGSKFLLWLREFHEVRFGFCCAFSQYRKSPRPRVPDRRHGTKGGTCSIIPRGDIRTMHQSLEIGYRYTVRRAKRSPRCMLYDRGTEEPRLVRNRSQYLVGPGYACLVRKGQADVCVVGKDLASVLIKNVGSGARNNRRGDQSTDNTYVHLFEVVRCNVGWSGPHAMSHTQRNHQKLRF